MSNLKIRVITSICLIAVMLPVIIFGGLFIEIVSGILTLIAAIELELMYKRGEKWNLNGIIDIILSVISYTVFLLSFIFNEYKFIFILLASVLLILGLKSIFIKELDIGHLGRSFITIFYPSIGFSSLAIIRIIESSMEYGSLFLFIFVILVCMMTDMFAYFFGIKFGKHKLSERISPHKTIEGSISGTVFGVLFASLFGIFSGLYKFLFPFFSDLGGIISIIVLSLLLSIIEEVGDLFASFLKRSYGIKDYSNIFPGHGGVLDRFDSYIFASTLMALYVVLII